MRGVEDFVNADANTHRSADDLDDGFVLDDDDKKRKKVAFTLAYKDGKAIVNEEEEEEKEGVLKGDAEASNDVDMGEEDESGDENEEDDDENEGYSDMEEDDDDDDDDGSDSDEEENKETRKGQSAAKKGILKPSGDSDVAAVAAKREIPYTFSMPSSLADLEEVLRPFGEKEQVCGRSWLI